MNVHMTYTEDLSETYSLRAATEDEATAAMFTLAGEGTYVDYCEITGTFTVTLRDERTGAEALIGSGYIEA